MDMAESFYFSVHVKNLLLLGWTTSSVAGLCCTCVVMASIAILLEGTKLLSAYLNSESKADPLRRPVIETAADERSPLLQPLLIPPSVDHIRQRKLRLHMLQTLVMLLHMLLGYLLMLAVMTYNAWIMVAALIGSGIGYFVFGVFPRGLTLETPGGQDRNQSGSDPEPSVSRAART